MLPFCLLILFGAVLSQPLSYCDNNWYQFNGHCIGFLIPKRTQRVAAEICKKNEAVLSIIDTQSLNNFIATQSGGSIAWFGLKCAGSEKSSCTWQNGRTLGEYSNFKQGHPNPALGECVAFDVRHEKKGEWISAPCDSSYLFTCMNWDK